MENMCKLIKCTILRKKSHLEFDGNRTPQVLRQCVTSSLQHLYSLASNTCYCKTCCLPSLCWNVKPVPWKRCLDDLFLFLYFLFFLVPIIYYNLTLGLLEYMRSQLLMKTSISQLITPFYNCSLRRIGRKILGEQGWTNGHKRRTLYDLYVTRKFIYTTPKEVTWMRDETFLPMKTHRTPSAVKSDIF